MVQRKTAASRFSRAVKNIAMWCRTFRHQPVTDQHRTLSQKLRGHDAYYGITGNGRALAQLRHWVQRLWHKWLLRRTGRRPLPWSTFRTLLERLPLPPPRVVHSAFARG